jgi:hypothetical protein
VIAIRRINDFYPTDPTADAVLFFNSFIVHLTAGDESKFSIFEVDLIFEKGRFRFTASGNTLESYCLVADPLFPSYKELAVEKIVQTDLRTVLTVVYDDIVARLDDDTKENIHLDDAVLTQVICEKIASSALYQYCQL